MIRNYSELRHLVSIEDRYNYLRLSGAVGKSTFGFDRFINQKFYKSSAWKRVRNIVIIRDNGCDLGIPGFEINDKIIIHHMNPILLKDIERRNLDILKPEFLICTSMRTHQAIHYSDESLLPQVPIERRPGDTRLWQKIKFGGRL
jgi:hypothetical protein